MAQHIEFARRLKTACDNNPAIPEKGRGQQVYISDHLGVSQEAVRRWFEGQSLPRNTKNRPYMKGLAKLLNCDEAWLVLGIAPSMDWKHKREYSKKAQGSAYIAFGMFVTNGHHCSFAPDSEESIDFHTIKMGTHMAVSVTTANEVEKGVWEIPVRPTYRSTVNIAMCQTGPARFVFLTLDHESITKLGKSQGGYVVVNAKKTGKVFTTGKHQWQYIEDSGVL